MQVWNAEKGYVNLFVHSKCSPLFLHFSFLTSKTIFASSVCTCVCMYVCIYVCVYKIICNTKLCLLECTCAIMAQWLFLFWWFHCNHVQFWTTNVSMLEEFAWWQTRFFKAGHTHHIIPDKEYWLPWSECLLPYCL